MVLLARQPQKPPPKEAVEVFITESCLGREVGNTDPQLQHLEAGQRYRLTPADAAQIVRGSGRALYVSGEDDATEDKVHTLTKAAQERVELKRRLAAEAAAERAEEQAFARAQRRKLIAEYGSVQATVQP